MHEAFEAIILAAGSGSRLQSVTRAPKCLVRINGLSLLQRHISVLRECGASRITLVVGFRADDIIAHLQETGLTEFCHFAFNLDYNSQGNSVSLLRGLESGRGHCAIFDADIVIDSGILSRFLTVARTSLLVGSGDENDEECAKAYIDGARRVWKVIDKRIPRPCEIRGLAFAGEAVGVIYLRDVDRAALIEEATSYLQDPACLLDNWEHVVTRFIQRNAMFAEMTGPGRWIEVDTPEDYAQAISLFSAGSDDFP